MHVILVFNPISGRGGGQHRAAAIGEVLAGRGHVAELVPSETGDAARWLGERLASVDAVVVVGGDGTVRSVAGVVAEAGIPLLHVPGGNENLFARGLGMTGDVDAVVAAVERGQRRDVDMATANGETMLLMASVGLDAEIVAEVAARRGRTVSNWTYARAALSQLRRCTPPRCSVVVDGNEVVSGQTGWCVVANSPLYGGRINPAPMAKLDDGLLDMVFFPASTSLGVLRWMNRCRRGRQSARAGFVHRTAASDVEITVDEPARLQIDGDPAAGGEPVGRVQVIRSPQSLVVLA
jgi:YegS/Rv2252/BmrU family lipid kinase